MLNNNIKIDLHIHSYASNYKEPSYKNSNESIVEYSRIENIDILLDKLLENKISLFSITDHNRYNFDLYDELENRLFDEKYNSLHVLHGIEFDVKLEDDKSTTHIIVIFNVKCQKEMSIINKIIKSNELKEKNDYYTKDKFETILKEIGLDTLLIVHQRCNLNRTNGNHNSLSEGVENPFKIIKVGYINALEYQKPNVEGIIKNNLFEYDETIALVTGSDCHDWRYYPKHDRDAQENEHYFSKCKILPSFKGLLLGLTSPKSRFNRNDVQNTNYIDCFHINGSTVELDPGINVIIGENGSGKSTLFSLLCNDESQKHVKKLRDDNNIFPANENLQFHVIKQAELVEKFQKDDLFKDDCYFQPINVSDFENEYNSFSEKLKSYIDFNIAKNKSYISLKQKNFFVDLDKESTPTFYVDINSNDLVLERNEHTERRNKLNTILEMILNESENEYYDNEEKVKLNNSLEKIKEVYEIVLQRDKNVELQNKIKNLILNEIKSYNERTTEISNSRDNEVLNYNREKNSFINDIISTIQLNAKKDEIPNRPKIIQGNSKKRSNGYIFEREMNFNNVDVSDKFFEMMFIKEYRDLNKVLKISTKSELSGAILLCGSENNIDDIWKSNFSKFLRWSTTQKSYIKEESTDDSIGNTLGEMSLVYYKFQTEQEGKWDVLMIDQPEDNISNNRIAKKLLRYFNNVRKAKQLILVTHNPLLVVNLDADNIIALTKINNKIFVKSGCLEDEDNNILDIVADTLDGGKDMIEKRLKIYGKESEF